MSFEAAYAQCLAEQGQEFVDACETAMRSKPLVTHDNLAELMALSQKGFARQPRELLALASGPTTSAASWCPASDFVDRRPAGIHNHTLAPRRQPQQLEAGGSASARV